MEENNNIIEAISSLAEIYESLNKSWNIAPCTTDVYQVFRQTKYHETYQKLNTVNIESLVLGIITNALDEKILVRLRNLLNNNIQIYETRQNEFTSIDFHEVYSLHEKQLYAGKFELLAKDREIIQDYPYPTERERQILLKVNTTEKNLLENERSDYIRSNAWMLKDYYTLIYEISKKSLSIIESYFPVEKKETPASEPKSTEQETQSEVEPDMIFRTGMFDKLLALEKKLTGDKYLNPELHWISVHDNGKPDIKRLVTFLVGLLDNRYFLPGRDPKIKTFFESRYHVAIGQNFERRRREPLLDGYKAVFYDYPF
ncbi:MAG: hypothetical protein LBR26_16745 [Prevotella sp.]|jgi:hypothetical protein|nr:hypothetical protein [Prevotella sp.]